MRIVADGGRRLRKGVEEALTELQLKLSETQEPEKRLEILEEMEELRKPLDPEHLDHSLFLNVG